MVLPIVAYGDPVLKKEAEEIEADHPGLKELLANMWETMYNSKGVGLAAPQVGESIRLFLVDASPFVEDDEYSEEEKKEFENFKKVFINPIMVEETGPKWYFEEGCLSIPDIREEVKRNPDIVLNYLDENFVEHEEKFSGICARIIQHEYDHIEGILFTDHLNPLRKRALKKRLLNIATGNVEVRYKMRFPKLSKARR